MKHAQRCRCLRLRALLSTVGVLLLVLFAPQNVQAGGNVIEGQVLDQRGTPVAGYPVSVRRIGDAGSPSAAITDNQGKFRVSGLPPGRYRVSPLNQPESTRREITIEPGNGKAWLQLAVQIR